MQSPHHLGAAVKYLSIEMLCPPGATVPTGRDARILVSRRRLRVVSVANGTRTFRQTMERINRCQIGWGSFGAPRNAVMSVTRAGTGRSRVLDVDSSHSDAV